MTTQRRPAHGVPDSAEFARLLRRIERAHDDRAVEAILRSGGAVDALNGSPVSTHVYRLECGHLTDTFGAPLPGTTRRLFCAATSCRRERNVVEHLTGRP